MLWTSKTGVTGVIGLSFGKSWPFTFYVLFGNNSRCYRYGYKFPFAPSEPFPPCWKDKLWENSHSPGTGPLLLPLKKGALCKPTDYP